MSSFASTFGQLQSTGYYFTKSTRHATYNYGQDSQSLYRNQPRLPFEYYVDIKINRVGSAEATFQQFFNNPDWAALQPLVKTVEMPSFKIETTPLNQYNRKRLSQTKIGFEPIKMVFHDVVDGKTLKFWEMYYRYYFGDGNEPDKNEVKVAPTESGSVTTESFLKGYTPSFNPNVSGLSSTVTNQISGETFTGTGAATNQLGNKSTTMNIVADTLDNHNFGFNLPVVQDNRNLIQQIDIYQVHGGRFNQVTLVNPRISAFTHDVLSYAESGKTLEITFTIEYEYAYYTIQNLQLGAGETNNNSTMEQFEHGEYLELPSAAFSPSLTNFIESNNPILNGDNPIISRIGSNVQEGLGTLTDSFSTNDVYRQVSSSSLAGMVNISPPAYKPTQTPAISTRPFGSSATFDSSSYLDVSRISGTGFTGLSNGILS
jgi:hypothetical protein